MKKIFVDTNILVDLLANLKQFSNMMLKFSALQRTKK